MTSAEPRVLAVYGVRYEPQWLVDEFRENLAWVDELVEVDDRARTDRLWVHEGEYRKMQRKALEEAGIRPWDYVIVTSPDERWGAKAEPIIRRLIAQRRKAIYTFPLREMFTATAYRTDGMWARKTRPRLFPYLPGQKFTTKKIQTVPTPIAGNYARIPVPRVPIYHLENIHPASRAERAIVYEALSPGSRDRAAKSAHWRRYDPTGEYIRRYGFAYLADTRGMKLAAVPKGDLNPPVTRPYIFRVPDDLLYHECGRTRSEMERWLQMTLADRRPRPDARGSTPRQPVRSGTRRPRRR